MIRIRSFALVLLALAVGASPARGQSGGVDGISILGGGSLEDGQGDAAIGVRLMDELNRWVAVELDATVVPDREDITSLFTIGAVALRYPLGGSLIPFGTVGLGATTRFIPEESSTRFTVAAGGGVHYWLTDSVGLRAEFLNYTVFLREPEKINVQQAQVGVTILFSYFPESDD